MPRSALTPHPPKLHGMGDVNELLARRVAEAQARTAAVLDEVTVVPPSRYATVDTTTGEIVEHREESASAPTGPRDGLLVDGVGEERCTSLPTGVSHPLAPASPAPLVDGVGGEATPSSSGSACPASPPAPLEWLPPRKNPNGGAQQTSRCGKYIIRKTIQQQRLLYWCWYQASGETRPKLLGYPPTKELAYARCQEHVSEGLQTP
jgi:hypothetical protein